MEVGGEPPGGENGVSVDTSIEIGDISWGTMTGPGMMGSPGRGGKRGLNNLLRPHVASHQSLDFTMCENHGHLRTF